MTTFHAGFARQHAGHHVERAALGKTKTKGGRQMRAGNVPGDPPVMKPEIGWRGWNYARGIWQGRIITKHYHDSQNCDACPCGPRRSRSFLRFVATTECRLRAAENQPHSRAVRGLVMVIPVAEFVEQQGEGKRRGEGQRPQCDEDSNRFALIYFAICQGLFQHPDVGGNIKRQLERREQPATGRRLGEAGMAAFSLADEEPDAAAAGGGHMGVSTLPAKYTRQRKTARRDQRARGSPLPHEALLRQRPRRLRES